MALRDWHGKHIGMVWAFGIAIVWLVGRLGVAAVGGGAPANGAVTDNAQIADSGQIAAGAQISAGGAPLWTTAVTLLILTILIVITVRWVRGHILDT